MKKGGLLINVFKKGVKLTNAIRVNEVSEAATGVGAQPYGGFKMPLPIPFSLARGCVKYSALGDCDVLK